MIDVGLGSLPGGGAEIFHPEVRDKICEHKAGADLVLTSGGASVGDHDLVQKALGEAGLAVDFWKIALRPGKPLMFGRFGTIPMLGLPGNPVSALVCALLFLRPALDRLLAKDFGGLLLGFAETLAAAYVSSAFKNSISFLLLFVVLLWRPQGLFTREATR